MHYLLSNVVPNSDVAKISVAVALGIGSSVVGYRLLSNYFQLQELQNKIHCRQIYRKEQFEKIRTNLQVLSAQNEEKWKYIVSLKFSVLVDELQNDSLSPLMVLHAYQWSSLKAHDQTNCITLFFEETEQNAKDLVTEFAGKAEKPPLYGIPFSVKEHIGVKGYDTSAGLVNQIDQPAPADACIVASIRNLGGVPFVQTNNPQTVMSGITSNPIYGTTCHPKDPTRSCGGSSGGEAALIALGGSPVGLGSDLAGSVRIPANYCGIAAIRPTSKRFTPIGMNPIIPGCAVALGASVGPMAPDTDTLITLLQNLWSPKSGLSDMDSSLVFIPFQKQYLETTTKLTIGYYDYDGSCIVTPANVRAVSIAKEALEQAGHRLVPWTPPKMEEVLQWFWGAVFLDGGKAFTELIRSEVQEPLHTGYYRALAEPMWLKRLRALLSGKRHHWLAGIPKNTSELRQIYANIQRYRREFVVKWLQAGLDCIICPPGVSPALPHDCAMKLIPNGAVNYTCLYNLLDFPAGVVPCTKVIAEDEANMKGYPDSDSQYLAVKESCQSGTVGLPIGIQCAALPYRDEVCLRIMSELEKLLAE